MYDLTQMGVSPQLREMLTAQAKFNAEDVAVVVKNADVTPEPTSDAWSYTVTFELQTAAGEVIPYTGNVAASSSDDCTGTVSIGDATPAVVMGVGEVEYSGAAGTYADTEAATLTITYTTAYGNDKTDTFVVTFTA